MRPLCGAEQPSKWGGTTHSMGRNDPLFWGRNDPLRRAERLITWGESTHAGRIDPGRIDRHPNICLARPESSSEM